jgi:phospholipase/carboxylesterase
MPAHTQHETAQHPAEGFRSIAPRGAPTRPLRVHLPTDYQPKYAYPLVVLFHADGECEEHAVRLVPLLSRRNYVTLCLRGPVKLGLRSDGRPAFGWLPTPDRAAGAALAHVVGQFSVHTDRVFLVGVGEGAAAAYRFGLANRTRVSGVVALNGTLPVGRVPANGLRVLIGHGTANPVVSVAEARRTAARLSAAGATVRVSRYSTSHRVHADMLRDANRWIMDQIADKSSDPHE